MNEDIINDLKQFIAATVSQAFSQLPTREELEGRFGTIDQRFDSLEKRMDKRFDDLDLKFSTIADAHAEMLDDHENRIKKLVPQVV